jgi:hypothetical protein
MLQQFHPWGRTPRTKDALKSRRTQNKCDQVGFNLLRQNGIHTYKLVQRTVSLHCVHSVFNGFLLFLEHTVTISPNSINHVIFVIETWCVSFTVRNEF